jgi:hypothetical protein
MLIKLLHLMMDQIQREAEVLIEILGFTLYRADTTNAYAFLVSALYLTVFARRHKRVVWYRRALATPTVCCPSTAIAYVAICVIPQRPSIAGLIFVDMMYECD